MLIQYAHTVQQDDNGFSLNSKVNYRQVVCIYAHVVFADKTNACYRTVSDIF